MHYCEEPSMVRVDFFKESGKWYTTEAIQFSRYDESLIHNAFENSLRAALKEPSGKLRLSGMWAVCLHPYHQHEHPLMMRVPEV
jgi:hypothetical protein